MQRSDPILEVKGLSVSFLQYGRGMRQQLLNVVHGLDLAVSEREIIAVVGASGSGKSLLAHAILGLLPYNAHMEGGCRFRGEPLDEARLRRLRGKEIVLVPQGVSYLDPLMCVGAQLNGGEKAPDSRRRTRESLARYGLGEEVERMYPFELSGGMARRVMIAAAVRNTPKLVIADEPTPGLNPEAARRILGHFREIADEGAGVLLITHDLEMALTVADRVAVFYAGRILEEASVADFMQEETLRHPYTRALWRAMPQNGFQPLAGAQPYAGEGQEGCLFASRCPLRSAECTKEPPVREIGNGWARCFHAGERGKADGFDSGTNFVPV